MKVIQLPKDPMKEKIHSFLFGDLFTTLFVLFAGMFNDLGMFAVKIVATLIVGAAGGIAGMAAKDFYPLLKEWYRKKRKKKNDE